MRTEDRSTVMDFRHVIIDSLERPDEDIDVQNLKRCAHCEEKEEWQPYE